MRFLLISVLAVLSLAACSTLQTRQGVPHEDAAQSSPAKDAVAEAKPQAAAPAPPVPATAAAGDKAAVAAQGMGGATQPATVTPTQDSATAPPTTGSTQKSAPEVAEQHAKPPPAPRDIWARMRQGFRLSGYGQARVKVQLRWYAKHHKYLGRVAQRAEPFLDYVLNEVERRGMPAEIALLPVVESAYQPFAYSHGRAAGIWQFIPSTGRLYGLKQNWWYDGRRDVVASTQAALDYLEKLHNEFNGDWLLALAAYNSGEGTVQRAIARNRRKGIPTDFWHLDLPRETQGYAPKLLAVSAIVADPAKYGISLKHIDNTPQVASIDVGSQIDLALAANMAGISLKEMYQLNPGFNRWATDPQGPHRLLIPVDKVTTFTEKLAALPRDKRIRWKRYKIRPGESLSVVARRYRTTVSMLRRVNRLRGNAIVAGKHLIIPVASRSLSSYQLSAVQRSKALRNRPGPGKRTIHVVRRGDTFWGLARHYSISVRRLAKWNGMAPKDYLRPGQKLVIWLASSRKRRAGMVPVGTSLPVAAMIRPISYIVRSGDSLARIAQRFSVSITQLCKWNGLDEEKYLQPGQRLTLYVDVTAQSDNT